VLRNLGAGATLQEIVREACGNEDITNAECVDVLLLLLTPASYSSNNTADTPGRRAFVSPAQVGAFVSPFQRLRLAVAAASCNL
jgi:hypothetical protein